LPSSENLFNTSQYALFAAPGALVVIWMAWRVMAWCLFHMAAVAAWLGRQPSRFQLPLTVGLLLVAWPLLLPALSGWLLTRLFPALALAPDVVPRLFARTSSRAFSHLFLFFLALPLVVVPLKFLAHRLAGTEISVWHWLLVYGPILVLLTCLTAHLRRMQD
jgi:hypothetical protein